jgi:RNA polymerase sigma-70 factor (ECF subfamily)
MIADSEGEEKSTKDRAFEEQALPFLEDVYRFARSMTRDEADADDLVQETYLRAYRSWDTFQPGSDARRWLFTIARNAFLRSREREQRKVSVGDDAELEMMAAGQSQIATPRGELEAALSRLDLAPAIDRALRDLPDVFRTAVTLVDVEGQSYDEAAEVLGVPVGTIRSRLFRGRRLLQDALIDYARDAGLVPAESARDVRGTSAQ